MMSVLQSIVKSPQFSINKVDFAFYESLSNGGSGKEETIMRHYNNLSPRRKRNLVERNRRIQLKDLFSKLYSLISIQNSELSSSDIVDQATTYVKHLQERVEKLKERKERLLKGDKKPIIYMKSSVSNLEVTIVGGLKKNFLLHQVIKVLEDEGAQVVSITYHNACDRVFYTINSQPISSRIGIETSKLEERLKKLIS